MPSLFRQGIPLALLLIVFVAGCRGQREATSQEAMENELKQIGLGYHEFQEKHRRAPANAEDLKPFVGGEGPLYRKLADGTYVFQYGIDVRDLSELGFDRTILAYEKKVPTEGGLVLMGDGAPRRMTADEFKGWPRPKGKGK
jgi:hypothetical protein